MKCDTSPLKCYTYVTPAYGKSALTSRQIKTKKCHEKVFSYCHDGIGRMPKHKITISIRMNISKTNAYQYAALYRLLEKRYGSRVSLYPAFVHDYEGGCQADICFEDPYRKAAFLKELYDKEGIYTKDIYPCRINKGCMSQQLNAYVVGPEGELYKCWHDLGVKEKEVGNIMSAQSIMDYSVLADKMIQNDVLFDEKCKSCFLFPSCSGGCTDHKNQQHNTCIPAKEMIEDFIDIRYMKRQTIEQE